ncbi:hypothetical protein GNP81_19170 [Aliivibrio fischeri]|uniref:DUF6414 family protein n=1 Tax=Aliivibrio fischeri TaxID=668 RepID=UPI0012D923A5|nr:hypothetical protein [Aliivibrio fischeri]MUK62702.1 hypothetical protein [Aliivibrio fischeri]MUL22946.1 hypothetical protein [Aliivibrio fischeri]MUL26714.1 hypothetical protein [Aliivibrio fischeri]
MMKNFVYIDEYKMYSLSSQVFEGVTEYLINDNGSASEDHESQKGPVASGRVLANIIKNENRVTHKKSLNDYSYILFEKQLFDMGKVLEINSENFNKSIKLVNDYSFVKITGKAVFHDVNQIRKTLESFNDFGEAITYVTNISNINQLKSQAIEIKSNQTNREEKSKIDLELKRLTNTKKLAKDNGLQQDERFLKDLSYLLSYGYHDQIDIQIKISDQLFSAPLDRECLRESEDLLIKKYARHTEKEFVIFGIVTQHAWTNDLDLSENKDFGSIKEALFNMVNHLTNIESAYTGRLANETVIEPIAIYTEL